MAVLGVKVAFAHELSRGYAWFTTRELCSHKTGFWAGACAIFPFHALGSGLASFGLVLRRVHEIEHLLTLVQTIV